MSLAFLALSLTYTGWSTYRSIVGQELTEDAAAASAGAPMDANMTKILTGEGGAAAVARVEEGAAATSGGEGGGEAAVPNLSAADRAEASLIWVFHLFLALAGAYMAMVITNWGNPDGVPDAKTDATAGRESMWLKIIAQWLTMLLYMWSLWAPVCRGEGEEY